MQLTTRPPRYMWFRLLSGSLAIAFTIWTVQQTLNYNMQLLDSLSFLAASIAIGVSALEHNVSIFDHVIKPLKKKMGKLQYEF